MCVMLICLSVPALSQTARTRIPITVTDRLGISTIITFGLDPAATYCTDDSLGERQYSPDWCAPWYGCEPCISFYDMKRTNDNYHCFGEGMSLDIRKYYSSSQVDTYAIAFDACDSLYPITFHWSSNLNLYYDSVRIHDPFTGNFYFANMLTEDSFRITNPNMHSLRITTRGPKTSTGVVVQNQEYPNQFLLQQNYPNPFNPLTIINYQLTIGNYVTLKVYDVFGREVAALVNGRKPAGQYEAEWNAEGLPSGVYFYRLQTGEYTSVKKMMLMR